MKLAINGGEPVRKKLFPGNDVIGEEERRSVNRVLDSKILSGFYGSWDAKFYGGSEVRALEQEWAEYFGARHAVSVNSATSGLYAAAGALGFGPGDEVIVSPYTMCASATAPLVFGAVPVFADIEDRFFCLDPDSVERAITPRTRGIVAVDIFGHPFESDRMLQIARKHNLKIIEDAAQAPAARYKGRWAGNLGHVGVFSLNYHKHIHCGEGGIVVTDDDEIAERVRLIRNHAEAVVGPKKQENIVNMIGFNFRMNEIEAAITRAQLKKLDVLVKERRERCDYLNRRLAEIPCLTTPATEEGCVHSYYVYALKYEEAKAGVGRERFVDAVAAELAPMELKEDEGACIWGGYVQPLYMQPLFQRKIAFGAGGFPWKLGDMEIKADYSAGICPVAEDMHARKVILHEYVTPSMEQDDLDDVVRAFQKVWELRSQISAS